jgi:hypothetical protein
MQEEALVLADALERAVATALYDWPDASVQEVTATLRQLADDYETAGVLWL